MNRIVRKVRLTDRHKKLYFIFLMLLLLFLPGMYVLTATAGSSSSGSASAGAFEADFIDVSQGDS
jgi:hypothetical protein